MRPAFCAIETIVPIRFCCLLQRPVIRRGSMQPSDRTNWLSMRTSVCLIFNPSVHSGQKFGWQTSFINFADLGDSMETALMTIALFSCPTWTGGNGAKLFGDYAWRNDLLSLMLYEGVVERLRTIPGRTKGNICLWMFRIKDIFARSCAAWLQKRLTTGLTVTDNFFWHSGSRAAWQCVTDCLHRSFTEHFPDFDY